MDYVVFPEGQSTQYVDVESFPFEAGGEVWKELPLSPLGGFFIDHIVDPEQRVIGLRYWLDTEFMPASVLARFRSDERFTFAKDGNFVDILFDVNASKVSTGNQIEILQDFGREVALQAESGRFAIAFSFPTP